MAKSGSLKVLVVDDHAAFRASVRQMFEDDHTVVTEADSGEAALRCFATERPDWIVMDLRMPGMGGLKATEIIHHLDPQVRIVVMSQFNEPEYVEQARRMGAIEFINKEDMPRLRQMILTGGESLQP